jgi:hypothetical protein
MNTKMKHSDFALRECFKMTKEWIERTERWTTGEDRLEQGNIHDLRIILHVADELRDRYKKEWE